MAFFTIIKQNSSKTKQHDFKGEIDG